MLYLQRQFSPVPKNGWSVKWLKQINNPDIIWKCTVVRLTLTKWIFFFFFLPKPNQTLSTASALLLHIGQVNDFHAQEK